MLVYTFIDVVRVPLSSSREEKKECVRGAADATESSSISADPIQLSAETRVIFSGF